jgi:hypothetical protein
MTDRYRNICFTVFGDELPIFDPSIEEFICYGDHEYCPSNGGKHYHGYCELAKRYRLSSLISYFPHGTHIEKLNRDSEAAINYCKKSNGVLHMHGIRKQTGHTKTVEEIDKRNKEITWIKRADETCNGCRECNLSKDSALNCYNFQDIQKYAEQDVVIFYDVPMDIDKNEFFLSLLRKSPVELDTGVLWNPYDIFITASFSYTEEHEIFRLIDNTFFY